MADPVGQVRWTFTPLAAFIADTPEATLIAAVGGGGKTSPFSTAMYLDYGDAYRHPPRLGNDTLKLIDNSIAERDSEDLERYASALKTFCLNGVVDPFWRDWALAEPSQLLTPEILHHSLKMFFDHDVKWCIQGVGSKEIDFHFSILSLRQGFRHFPEGISELKQVTGKGHRDIMHYLVSVIAGGIPKEFLLAIRAAADF